MIRLGQHRTMIVVQMRSRFFRLITKKDADILSYVKEFLCQMRSKAQINDLLYDKDKEHACEIEKFVKEKLNCLPMGGRGIKLYSYCTATPKNHDFFISYHKVLGSIVLLSGF